MEENNDRKQSGGIKRNISDDEGNSEECTCSPSTNDNPESKGKCSYCKKKKTKVKSDESENAFTICINCIYMNTPTANYCTNCGEPLEKIDIGADFLQKFKDFKNTQEQLTKQTEELLKIRDFEFQQLTKNNSIPSIYSQSSGIWFSMKYNNDDLLSSYIIDASVLMCAAIGKNTENILATNLYQLTPKLSENCISSFTKTLYQSFETEEKITSMRTRCTGVWKSGKKGIILFCIIESIIELDEQKKPNTCMCYISHFDEVEESLAENIMQNPAITTLFDTVKDQNAPQLQNNNNECNVNDEKRIFLFDDEEENKGDEDEINKKDKDESSDTNK